MRALSFRQALNHSSPSRGEGGAQRRMRGHLHDRQSTCPTPTAPSPPTRLTGEPIPFVKHKASDFPRIAYAAAHVVADPAGVDMIHG